VIFHGTDSLYDVSYLLAFAFIKNASSGLWNTSNKDESSSALKICLQRCSEALSKNELQVTNSHNAESLFISHRFMRFIVADALKNAPGFEHLDGLPFDVLFAGCFDPPFELQSLRFDSRFVPNRVFRSRGNWAHASDFNQSKNVVILENDAKIDLLGENPFCIHFCGSNDLFDGAISIGMIWKGSKITKPGILWIESKFGVHSLSKATLEDVLKKKDLVDAAWGKKKEQLLLIVTNKKLSEKELKVIKKREETKKDVLVVCNNGYSLYYGLSPTFARMVLADVKNS